MCRSLREDSHVCDGALRAPVQGATAGGHRGHRTWAAGPVSTRKPFSVTPQMTVASGHALRLRMGRSRQVGGSERPREETGGPGGGRRGAGQGRRGFAVGLTLCPLLVGMCRSDPDRGGLEFGDV